MDRLRRIKIKFSLGQKDYDAEWLWTDYMCLAYVLNNQSQTSTFNQGIVKAQLISEGYISLWLANENVTFAEAELIVRGHLLGQDKLEYRPFCAKSYPELLEKLKSCELVKNKHVYAEQHDDKIYIAYDKTVLQELYSIIGDMCISSSEDDSSTGSDAVAESLSSIGASMFLTSDEVDIEEKPTQVLVWNVPRKVDEDYLEMFFENTKKHGGGTVVNVELNEGDGVAIVEFEEPDAVDVVLRKQRSKPIIMAGVEIKVEARVPRMLRNEADANLLGGEGQTTKILVIKIPERALDEEYLELFFEKNGGTVVSIQIFTDFFAAVVEFDTAEAVVSIMSQLLKMYRTEVKILPYNPRHVPRDTIEVRGQDMDSDELEMYFESEKHSNGGPIKTLDLNEDRDVAYITYRSEEVAKRVADKSSHTISKQQLLVEIYQQSDPLMDFLKQRCGLDDDSDQNEYEKIHTKTKNCSMLVAAIDFGTTHSRCAFSFRTVYEEDPCDIFVKTSWEGGAALSEKTLTCALFDENREFHSCGYPAEDKYADLALDGKHKKWLFFKRFKMNLYCSEVTRDMFLEAEGGQKMEAMTVFGEYLAHLRQQILDELERQGGGVSPDDIHWVVTVPAIWSDATKQFIREAAEYNGTKAMAKIKPNQLSIVLVPEAAYLYSQMIPADEVRGCAGARQDIAKPRTKFMVIDLGGMAVDITVHMKRSDGTLHELYMRRCPGHTQVDAEFEHTLIKLVGSPTYRKFCLERKDDHTLLLRDFESVKRRVKATSKMNMRLRVPMSLADCYKDNEGDDITKVIANSVYKDKVKWVRDKLIMEADLLLSFFKTCCENIVNCLKQVMAAPNVQGTNIFLMVGDFADCDIMQNAISTAFPDVKLVIPKDSSLAVVKGAVIYGHQPTRISTHVTKYTFGVKILPPFDPKIHPADHKVEVGGEARCRDVFKPYVQIGTKMDVGQAAKYKHVTLKSSQREMHLKLFASEDAIPRFTDDNGVWYLGKLVVNLPANTDDNRITVKVALIFGVTELRLEAETSTGIKYSAFFDLV